MSGNNSEQLDDKLKSTNNKVAGAVILVIFNSLFTVAIISELIVIKSSCSGVISTGCKADEAIIMAFFVFLAFINFFLILLLTNSALKSAKQIQNFFGPNIKAGKTKIISGLAIGFGFLPLIAWLIGAIF